MAVTPAEAFVIGSGPNGLTAAITLARAGLAVTVLEAQETIGGGARSAALTLPGFIHDVCSAVHPLAFSSPAFASMPLAEHGLEWIQPTLPVAHPLDGGRAATAERPGGDAAVYRRIVAPLASHWRELLEDILAPPLHIPFHPMLLARFGALAPWPAARTARTLFRTEETRAWFAGMAAHSMLPLEMAGSAAFGWVLSVSVQLGWPIARGGSQAIANALVSYFKSLGGTVHSGREVRSIREFPASSIILCDLTPRQLLRIAADRLPDSYCRKLERYRYGPGVFKIDWALHAPIPWRNPDCRKAGTVHVGGTLDEIADSERAAWYGQPCGRPFVLLAQPSLFDSSRAPAGKHTAWAYCHVPNGSPENMTSRIEAQVERFAPGFAQTVLARHTSSPAELEAHNANLVGGDIAGGANDIKQLLLRPAASLYRTPCRGLFLCSSSTPPGAGVHGMCGYHAARAALREGSGAGA